MRLDLYLTTKDYCESRNKSAYLISSGVVFVNGKRVTKASYSVNENDEIVIINDEKTYVARSAAKLLTAIEVFNLDFNDKIAVDLGASTGGFCEVMLDNNVRLVYAIDIGTNQLHPKIKSDKRIVNKEHTNARYLSAVDFDFPIDIVTCDLSFISLKLVLNAVMCILKKDGEAICLIKPQFEVGSTNVGKNGVVKDLKLHINTIVDISKYAFDLGFEVKNIAFSGLEGESGNREYLLHLKKSDKPAELDFTKINKAVMGDKL